MRGEVSLTGSFHFEDLEKILLNIKTLMNQPPLPVFDSFINPTLSYREIRVRQQDGQVRYHIRDMGFVDTTRECIPISKEGYYSEEEVEELK